MQRLNMNELKVPQEVIRQMAEEIDMGMVCFLNTDTMEYRSIMGRSYEYCGDGTEEINREICKEVDTWEHWAKIEPLESWDSFRIMENFIENCIPEKDGIKSRLWDALSKRKPFQNFKFIIDNSKYRQKWFDFKQSQLEQHVREELLYKIS